MPIQYFTFEFIGSIPENCKIHSSNIIYYGSIIDVEKIKRILSDADVLVCPSYSEGMPTVILEAMACGLAVIASDVGAVEEQVDRTNGLLIKAGSNDELKNALNFFINLSDKKLVEMKNNSIKKIKNRFLWKNVISLLIEKVKADERLHS
jgi:glycosyltransferase involved in cell wall biosynthesis